MRGLLSVLVLLTGIFTQGAHAGDSWVRALKKLPVSQLPDPSSVEPTQLVIGLVESGAAVILYNDQGRVRVFFDGSLPGDFSKIRIVSIHVSESNKSLLRNMVGSSEIKNRTIAQWLIEYVNQASEDQLGKIRNVHYLRL